MTNRRTRDTAALPSDDLGEFGEVSFLRLCAEAGIAANRVQRDKYGWDVLVEVPMVAARPHVGFGETDPAVRTCKVQVKTTQHGEPTAKIKLSNWAIMARELYPWFIVHIGVDGRRVKSVRIGHVGKDLVESALKRVFLAERAGKALHKVAWRCSSKHLARIPSNGTGLLAALRAHLGKSASGYTAEKCAWRDNAGYDEGRFTFSFETTSEPGPSAHVQVAKLVTGEIEAITPSSFSLSETRFGVTSSVPMGPPGSVHSLRIPTPPSTGMTKIVLSRHADGDFVELACKTYNAGAVIPGLPKEESRVRFVSDGFSLLIAAAGRSGVSIKIDLEMPAPDHPVRLDSLVRQATMFDMLTSRQGGVTLDLCWPGGVHSIPIPPIEASAEARLLAYVAQCVGRVCADFGILMEYDVVPKTLLANERDWILFGSALADRTLDLRIETKTPLSASDDLDGKRVALLSAHRLALGSSWVSAALSIEGIGTTLPSGAVGIVNIRPRVVVRHRTEAEPKPLEELLEACKAESERLLAEGFALAAVLDSSGLDETCTSDIGNGLSEAAEQGANLLRRPSLKSPSTTVAKLREAKPRDEPGGG